LCPRTPRSQRPGPSPSRHHDSIDGIKAKPRHRRQLWCWAATFACTGPHPSALQPRQEPPYRWPGRERGQRQGSGSRVSPRSAPKPWEPSRERVQGRGVPPQHRHKIQPGYGCARAIRQSAPNGAYRELSVYGQESCAQPENDHREDEENSPRHPEGGLHERHKARRCRPSPGSRTQDGTRNRKSTRRKMMYDVLREKQHVRNDK
jgi:hypothetical protein